MIPVTRMIEYFNFVHPSDKQQVAKYINDTLAYTLEMVQINKSHPFYHYLDKRWLAREINNPLKSVNVLEESEINFLKGYKFDGVLAAFYRVNFRDLESSLINLDKFVINNIDSFNIEHLHGVSKIIDSVYNKVLHYFNNSNDLIYYSTIKNMSDTIFRCIVKRDFETISRYENLIDNLLSTKITNIYYLSRVILILQRASMDMYDERGIFKRFVNIDPDNYKCRLFNVNTSTDIINLVDTSFDLSKDVLLNIKQYNENALRGSYINTITSETNSFNESEMFNLNYETYLLVHHMKKNTKESLINKELKGLSLDLDASVELILERLNYFCVPIYTQDTNRRVLLAINKTYDEVYLVMYDKEIILVLLSEDDEYIRITDLIDCPREDIDSVNKFKIKILKYKQKTDERLEVCTEGINISKDGTLSFSYKVKKTYMDEYMQIHNVLIHNSKENNIEGIKQNLVHTYLLLDKIEEERYKKKINQSEDLLKARAFVINDFKTYLKQVQKSEPKFDFYEYLQKSDYSKIFINITPDNITGVKKILKTLIL